MGKNNVTFRMRIASFVLSLCMILGLSPASHSEDLSGAITVWWWGEEQTPGLQEWMANTVEAFEEAYPTIDVDAVYQNTDAIIPAWEAAMQSQSGPDITFFWSTGDLPRAIWNGSLAPLNDLISEEERAHYPAQFLNMDSFDGQLYAVPWIIEGYPIIYNKKLFAQAGLDPDTFPLPWEEFIGACKQLREHGITPISFGLKGGWHLGYLMPGLFMSLVDSQADYLELFVGGARFTDPEYAVVWTRIRELLTEGCFNEDVASVDFYEAQSRFAAGEVAMTIGNASSGSLLERHMGPDIVGLAPYPVIGDGSHGGTYSVVDQKLAITSWSDNKEEASAFLRFIHTPDVMADQYRLSRAIPADDRFDTAILSSFDKANVALMRESGTGPYLQALNPPQWEYGTLYTVAPGIFIGNISVEEGATQIEAGMSAWRENDPDAVENYRKWAQQWTD